MSVLGSYMRLSSPSTVVQNETCTGIGRAVGSSVLWGPFSVWWSSVSVPLIPAKDQVLSSRWLVSFQGPLRGLEVSLPWV